MDKHTAIVTRVRQQSHDVVTLYFTLDDGSKLDYTAGQYITVYIDGGSHPEGKAYSLSSAPHQKYMSITIKKVGEYSGYLHSLKAGDRFTISSAYGFFNPMSKRPLVCISAGVGIAPIWSVLKDELKHDASRVAHLFYSNKTTGDIAFHDAITARDSAHESLKVAHHITRQDDVPAHMHIGRIDLDKCVEAVEDEANYLICGSVDFVRSMWRGLSERGIAPELISTETFFES